jgi:hypothetical protein
MMDIIKLYEEKKTDFLGLLDVFFESTTPSVSLLLNRNNYDLIINYKRIYIKNKV